MPEVIVAVGDGEPKPLELKFNDKNHAYWLSGKRAKGVTTVAKIAADDYAIRNWHERMVAIGIMLDANLRENVAAHIDNIDRLKDLCEDAKKVAKAHEAGDRGTQMHHVLEMVLLDKEHRLFTEQQQRDALVLKRTLNRYQLTPYNYLSEQFVAYPEFVICGRFDAVMQKADGTLILVDLKSGINAIKYPHATAAQLAMYANAPHISHHIEIFGNRSTVTEWHTMPDSLDRRTGYVLLVQPGVEVGTLHEIDIRHGWFAAQRAMDLIAWRKLYKYGDELAVEAQPAAGPKDSELLCAAQESETVEALRDLWAVAYQYGLLNPKFRQAVTARAETLKNLAKAEQK